MEQLNLSEVQKAKLKDLNKALDVKDSILRSEMKMKKDKIKKCRSSVKNSRVRYN